MCGFTPSGLGYLGARNEPPPTGTVVLTWEALEEIVGLLEGGQSISFASGMAGVAAVENVEDLWADLAAALVAVS